MTDRMNSIYQSEYFIQEGPFDAEAMNQLQEEIHAD